MTWNETRSFVAFENIKVIEKYSLMDLSYIKNIWKFDYNCNRDKCRT